ncbi:EF-P 5-aminopentanol modification-associated protein YfmH [Haloplasma contractile]|uniref:Zinc protease insulinase family protein n=1 Tax=Haloplasma contractile SSD-17B TaxID=1033810 RepID=U2EG29_9MOLU|nr:pitrilysin family protein [Haloplasma contractile]ERJ13571.1 Zinc protease insulinase family protein [Haloplasma contractile SSD-17B]
MERIVYDNIKEQIFYEQLENGLQVYLLPKPGFNKYYGTFTTKYGSIDNQFTPIGKTELVKVPDGIAHFLEHKMFESEEGDVFEEFTKFGANTNAFTAFNRTAYLFSCTSNFEQNLNILLNFVQEPYFTDESVEKEKGIIAQEIKMYDDNPDWRLYFGTIDNLYKENPVKVDIAGTVESIDQITKEHLYECYNTFYHPSNMLLFVVGDFNPEETIQLIKNNQGKRQFPKLSKLERNYIFESNQVDQVKNVLHMDVGTPKVHVAIKDGKSDLQGMDLLRKEIAMDIIFDHLFSRSSDYYKELMEEQLINDTFGYELTFEYSYGFALAGGDTSKPDELAERLRSILLEAKNLKMTQEAFDQIKHKKLGATMKGFNSIENIANSFTRFKFNDMNLFDAIKVYEEFTLDELNDYLDFFSEEAITTMMVLPNE